MKLSHRILVAVAALGTFGMVGSASAFAAPAPSSPSPPAGSTTLNIPATSTGGTWVSHSNGATLTVTIGPAIPEAVGPTTAGVGAAASQAMPLASAGYVYQYVSISEWVLNDSASISGTWQYNGTYAYGSGSSPYCDDNGGYVTLCAEWSNGEYMPYPMMWVNDGFLSFPFAPPLGYSYDLDLFGNGSHRIVWVG